MAPFDVDDFHKKCCRVIGPVSLKRKKKKTCRRKIVIYVLSWEK
jgi:hypothetical protein